MIAGGAEPDQQRRQRFFRRLSPRKVAIAVIVGGLIAVPIALQVRHLQLAQETWPGSVGTSIYRQGESYQDRVTAIERQNALGWRSRVIAVTSAETPAVAIFDVELRDDSGHPVNAHTTQARFVHPLREALDSSTVEAVAIGDGRYRIRAALPQGGRWELRFYATAANGTPYRRDFEIKVSAQ